jgi:curli production assembly/transport component CsgF
MKKIILALAISTAIASSASADEIRFKFNNPAFGGNPFNGPYLLSNAQVQRQFKDPESNKSPTEEFSENIMRSLLSQISREISDQIVGENAKDSGHIEVESTMIDFRREGDNVKIDVFDALTGDNTTIKVPVGNFQ